MPKVSIILFVYMTEKYIQRCFESIQKHTFSDVEVIHVDDGSHDESRKICDEYASKERRFKVNHQPNGGVSRVRSII